MQRGDAELLQTIRDAGTDMSRRREVAHFVFFDTEEQARAAAAALPDEYETEAYGTEGWVLRAWHTVVLNEDYIAPARLWWEAFAQQHGGEYDGWETDPDPSP
jgi:hypothetical protein